MPSVQEMISALASGANNYLGIPPGETKNAAGQVVFPTNALERTLQQGSAIQKEYIPSAIGIKGGVRAPAPLSEPPASVGLSLKRSAYDPMLEGEHYFDFVDPKGQKVGNADVGYDPTNKRLHILGIGSDLPSPLGNNSAAYGFNNQAHSLGYSNMRSLVRALQKEFPEATNVVGIRNTGAREGAADPLAQFRAIVKLKGQQ